MYGEVIHAGPPKGPSVEEYETSLDGYDPRKTRHLILDRFHVGEYVWPKIFGRDSDYDLSVQTHVEMFMMSRGAIVVYGSRDHKKLKKDLVANNEPLNPKDINKAEQLFAEARAFSGQDAFTWDYEHNIDEDIYGIIAQAKYRAENVRLVWDTCGPGWVGNPDPKVLYVGDELGPLRLGTVPPDDIPFAPYRSTSGHYLMRAIPQWWRSAIVNSRVGRDRKIRNLDEIWWAMNKPAVVALGKEAEKVVKSFNLPYNAVPHPQYWRRFRHKEVDTYKSLLLEAEIV